MPDRQLLPAPQIHSRVGRTPSERLQWALSLAQRDLGALTEGDWSNLSLELAAFDAYVVPHDQVNNRWMRKFLRQWTGRPGPPLLLPTKEEVRGAHAEFRRMIGSLVETGKLDVGPVKMTFSIHRELDVGRFWQFPERQVPGQLTLVHLLGAYAPLVRKCPEPKCQRWFLAGRKNQWYCSTRCQTRAATRAYRAALAKKQRVKRTRKGGR